MLCICVFCIFLLSVFDLKYVCHALAEHDDYEKLLNKIQLCNLVLSTHLRLNRTWISVTFIITQNYLMFVPCYSSL